MGIREDLQYLEERKKMRKAEKETAKKRAREKTNNRIIADEDIKIAHEQAVEKYYDYKDNVQHELLKKALVELCTQSIPHINYREQILCENLVDKYINETGAAKLLRNMKFSDNYLLRTIHEKVKESQKEITKDTSADDESTQIISKKAIDDFWTEIDNAEDIADITNIIRMRVSNAEEEFINKNQEDKEAIKTILKQTASRVQKAKESENEEYAEAVEESETRLAKNKIYQIQHESHRNVFDKMVRQLSKAALSNDVLKEDYINENGKIEFDRIVETVRCMYTLLETVSTIQLEKVDTDYIKNIINSIK